MGLKSALTKWIPPISTFVTFMFTRPGGWGSVYDHLKANNLDMAAQSGIRQMTGVRLGGIGGQNKTQWDAFASLNPINFDEAPAAKVGFVTSFALRAMGTIQAAANKMLSELL
jgi:hypothetical protein